MAALLGVDFGTSNTVLATWSDDACEESHVLQIEEYEMPPRGLEQFQTPVIPSFIHYETEDIRWLGRQVLDRGLDTHHHTFRRMKAALMSNNPKEVRVEGAQKTARDAATDFLRALLLSVPEELRSDSDRRVAFSVPVEAYEKYPDWLDSVAGAAGLNRVGFIDEPSAAALGYGGRIKPGDMYLVIDFGAGTLDVAVARIQPDPHAAKGRHCQVLGKAGDSALGGVQIDRWLYHEVLRRAGYKEVNSRIRSLRGMLEMECERAKQALTYTDRTSITVVDPDTGEVPIGADITRDEFDQLLLQNGLIQRLDECLNRALTATLEKGVDALQSLSAVILVGGSTLIPCVKEHFLNRFDAFDVWHEHPLDAVARGAAAFLSDDIEIFDYIQHEYAIRRYDTVRGEYLYQTIVGRGSSYPRPKEYSLVLTATVPDQREFGIDIFELGEERGNGSDDEYETRYDQNGLPRTVRLTQAERERRYRFWLNESQRTFLSADPPAEKGEYRFQVEFAVDNKRRLIMTAWDLRTSELIHRDYPVVKLR